MGYFCDYEKRQMYWKGEAFFLEGGVFSLSIHFMISLSPSPCSILTVVHKNDF